MEHFIEVGSAYDMRDPNPEKNFGIHGAEVKMFSRGEHGVVQFIIFSNRFLSATIEELIQNNPEYSHLSERDLKKIRNYSGEFTSGKELEEIIEHNKFINQLELDNDFLIRPNPADLGYHSPIPMFEGQEPIREIYKKMELIHLENGEIDFIPPVYGDAIICPYLLNDAPCYYDGSGLNAKKVFDILNKQGIEETWNYLDNCYQNQFADIIL